MQRVYSYYDENTFEKLSVAAKERGFLSLSSFQKYCTILYMGLHPSTELEDDEINMGALLSVMKLQLKQMKIGETFIVSSLVPEKQWAMLNRSQKITLAIQLKKYVRTHEYAFEFVKYLPGKIKQYKKIKDLSREIC